MDKVWQRWVRGGLLALSAVLACFLVYLLVTNSTMVPTPTAAAPGSMDSADATISQFTFTQTNGDTVQWQVQAQEARLFERDKTGDAPSRRSHTIRPAAEKN